MSQNRRSSEEMASLASLVLNDRFSIATSKQLAASVLSQAAPSDPRGHAQRRTREEMASLAGIVLASPYSTEADRQLAGSVLSQRAY